MTDPYIGEIRIFAGNFAPQGWSFCNGAVMPISQYTALYQLIGTTYGGDGVNTFNLPDLRGRVPLHQGSSPGGSTFVTGGVGGAETVTLGVPQMPNHTHVAQGQSSAGTLPSPANNVWAASALNQFSQTAPNINMHANLLGLAGNSQPHDNMLPFLSVNFILSLFGIYPSQ